MGYDSVTDDIMWGIVVCHLPLLKAEVEKLLEGFYELDKICYEKNCTCCEPFGCGRCLFIRKQDYFSIA